jgi:hypothetical protein
MYFVQNCKVTETQGLATAPSNLEQLGVSDTEGGEMESTLVGTIDN